MSRWALAYCSGGLLGLITSEQPVGITYNDGNTGLAWTGLQVTGGWIAGRGGDEGRFFRRHPGTAWSSRNPAIVVQLSEAEGARLAGKLMALRDLDYGAELS